MATYTPTLNSGTDYTSSLAVGDIIQGNYTGNVIPVTLPAGQYKLECWGAQGGEGYPITVTSGTSTTSWTNITSSNVGTYCSSYGAGSYTTSSWTTATYSGTTYNCIRVRGSSSGRYGVYNFVISKAGTYRIFYSYSLRSSDIATVAIIYANGDRDKFLCAAEGSASLSGEYQDISLSVGDRVIVQHDRYSSGSSSYYVQCGLQYQTVTTTPGTTSIGSATSGGYGGYSVGTLTLQDPTVLYMVPGGKGGSSTSTTSDTTTSGGYNGGGSAKVRKSSSGGSSCGGGGGASDIRINSNDLYARVIVAGGGGGSAGESNAQTQKQGGGTSGASATASYAGTQAAAGSNGSFGTGASTTSSGTARYGPGGGGGGWYGGGVSTSTSNTSATYRTYNGGGSGYVYTADTASNYPSGCTLNSSYYLTDASTATSTQTGNGLIKITVIELLTEISNGAWTYLIGETLYPNSTLQTSSPWILTGTSCKKFTVIPQESGYLKIYSNGNIDTYGYIGTTNSTTINSSGVPANYDKSNDDNGDDYGASYANAFGFYMPVTANTKYYLWVRPYSSDRSAEVSISHQVTAGPKLEARFLKVNSTTWVKI